MNPRITLEQYRVIANFLSMLAARDCKRGRCFFEGQLDQEQVFNLTNRLTQAVFSLDLSKVRGARCYVISLYYESGSRLMNDNLYNSWLSLASGIDNSDGECDV